ncbi:MAG: hypothetical protein GC160_19760 [Acidobacteria bacterium]|nr:hypothetical protein [Acidobacteriota bacterium]
MPDIRFQIAVNRELDNDLTADAAEIEVQQTIEGPTTFRVRFAVDICGADMRLLEDERLQPSDPDTEITVLAILNGVTYVLSHGVIAERQVSLAPGGPGSYLEIRGKDRRVVMDREQRNASHSGTAADIVTPILSRYGFEADVADTPIEYDENSTTLNQTETDLAFVDQLAGRSDVRFWIDWSAENGLAGFEVTETAHFKPSPPRSSLPGPLGGLSIPILAPDSPPELRLNSGDGCANVASFEVSSNAEAPTGSGPIERVAPDTGEVDETETPAATTEPLGSAASGSQARTRRVVSAGSAQEAQLRTQAALNDASWTVQATAETSVHALNGILAAHQTVRVSGGGSLNSGNYFIKSVTHAIDASDHKMRLELMRNGLGAAS